jgi:hypothetical protein
MTAHRSGAVLTTILKHLRMAEEAGTFSAMDVRNRLIFKILMLVACQTEGNTGKFI